jgi:hypothetical protein
LFLSGALPESEFGVPHPGFGVWASSIRIMDLAKSQVFEEITKFF